MPKPIVNSSSRSRAVRKKLWQHHLAAQTQSGLSPAEYCRRNHLAPGSFSRWKKRLGASTVAAPLALVPVAVLSDQISTPPEFGRPTDAKSGLTLVVGYDCRIEIGIDFHIATLARLLSTVGGR